MATYTNAVQKLYVAYFNRPADAAGLAYWEGVVTAANGNTAAVSGAFAASAEYQTEYSQLTLNGVVAQVYQNLFGHAPDTAGQAYWVKALNDKVFTIDQVVTQIAAGAQTTDKVAYDSKVLVATAFTNALDTAAEKAGYTGTDANEAAKDFLSTITTEAQATAAIAPTALDVSVAGVIKAGVPFTLTGALTALVAANEARADFLEEAEATPAELTTAVATAVTALDGKVAGTFVAQSEGVIAAMIADQIKLHADALALHQKAVTTATAEIAKVAGLSSAVATDAAADAAVTAAGKVVTAKESTLAGLEASYEVTSASALTINADGTASSLKAAVTTQLIRYDATAKALVLVDGITETTNPGITAILAASIAKEAADKVQGDAVTVAAATQVTLNRLDYAATAKDELVLVGAGITLTADLDAGAVPTPVQITAEIAALAAAKVAADATFAAIVGVPSQAQIDAKQDAADAVTDFAALVSAFDAADSVTAGVPPVTTNVNPLVDILIAAEAAVKADNTLIKNLNTAIANLDKANAAVAELEALDDAIDAAGDIFVAHDFAVPVTLGAVAVGTAETDIFVTGTADSQIFSMTGDDVLFVGADYVLNAGKLSTGANGALEVFIAQVGGDTVVTIETETYGSASGDTIAITLTGVTATDVHFANGIITV